MHQLFLFCLIIIASAFAQKKDTSVQFYSDKIFEVKAGEAVMKISANGGRIISFRMGKNELLTNENEHENFGSTFWPAPQSNWGWPPYSVLDKEEYSVEKIGDTLKMKSSPDSISGLQFEKNWLSADNKFIRIEYLIRNIAKNPKAVAPWEVTRVPCGGLAFFPDGGNEKVPASTLKNYEQIAGINWVPVNKTPAQNHEKLFATASEGWLAYALNGVLFIKQFPDTRQQEYSPNQGEVEIYTNKEKSYSELESQGSYTLLQPGQSLRYVTTWFVVPIPKTINIYNGNLQLSSFARSQVSLIGRK
jgi:Domain of unknown function (DUF4380)